MAGVPVREEWDKIRSFSTGGNYVNFQLAEEDTARTADACGKNHERLRRIKAAYDLGDLFPVNRNIPSGQTAASPPSASVGGQIPCL